MKEIVLKIISTVLFLAIYGFMLTGGVHRLGEIYSEHKEPSKIWIYKFIEPKTPEFKIGEAIRMISKSIYWAVGVIIWEDYLLCSSDYGLKNMTNEELDKKIEQQKHRKLETTFTERKTTGEFGGRGDDNNDGILNGEWIFGGENTISGKKFFRTREIGDHCYIRSYQTFWYNGVPKEQKFTSGPFNIIK